MARTTHFALHVLALDAPVMDASGLRPLFDRPVTWIGAMAPKRWAKRAVTRITIKRQIFAVSGEFESALSPAAHVVRLRCSFDRAQFISATSQALKVAVRQELQQLFAKATARQAQATSS
jgi:ribonuclease P protein component